MSIPADPQAQLSLLLELNEDITAATVDLDVKNAAALEAAAAADDAQLHLTALHASRDELLDEMKRTAPPAAGGVAS